MSTHNFYRQMERAVREHNEEEMSLDSLFSWLPSCASAKKHFDDYTSEVCFNRGDTLKETLLVMTVLSGHKIGKEEAIEWFTVSNDVLIENSRPGEYSDETRLESIREFFRTQFNGFEIAFKE